MSMAASLHNGLFAIRRRAWKPGFHSLRGLTVETWFPPQPAADANPHASHNRTTRSAWKPGFHSNGGSHGQHA